MIWLTVILLTLATVFCAAFFIIKTRESQRRNNAELTSNFRRQLEQVEAVTRNPDYIPPQSEQQAALPEGSGDKAKMQQFIGQLFQKMLQARRDYMLKVEALKMDSLLDPARLQRDMTLAESKEMTRQARVLTLQYKAGFRKLLEDAGQQIESMDLSAPAKKGLLEGYKNGFTRNMAQFEQAFSLEEQVLDKLEAVIRLLSVSKEWSITDGQIVFSSTEDLEKLNKLLAEINEIAQEQERLEKQRQAKSEQSFKLMQELSK